MSWRDTIRPSESGSSGWRSTIAPLSQEPQEIERRTIYGPEASVLEGLTVGGLQGVTLDNLDEILARGQAMFGEGNYEQYLEEERKRLAEIEQGAPVSSFVGRLGGYAIPGLGVARFIKPATTLGRAGIEAGMGAVQGLGAAEDTEDIPASVAAGAGFGAGSSLGIDALAKALRSGASKVGDVLGSVVFQTPPEVSQALRANPRALENAKSSREIADILAQRAGELRGKVSSQRTTALDTLTDKPLKGKIDLIRSIQQLPEQFAVSGATKKYPGSQAILKEVNLARNAIANAKTQKDIKNILARLDEKADFQTPSGTQINAVRKQIRGLIDRQLKEENPLYAATMEPLAQSTQAFREGIKEARFERGLGGALIPTDRTAKRMKSLSNSIDRPDDTVARERLAKLYPEIEQELRKSKLARQAQGGVTTGSRNVLLSGGVGGVADLLGVTGGAGAVSGMLAGAAIDRYGRTLGSALAKNSGRAGRFLDRFGDYFKGVANKEATHQFLMEFDPEYSKMFNELQESGNFNDPAQIIKRK